MDKLRRVFDGWRKINKEEKTKLKIMKVFVERSKQLDVAASFQKWQQYTVSENQRKKESKVYGTRALELSLDRLVKRRMALALHQLRMRGHKKEFKLKFMKRMLMHCAAYRTRYYFDRWKHCVKLEQIADTVNVS